MKSTDHEMKYNAAVNYYNNHKYYQALQLLEELISVFKGTSKAEQVYYYYCKSYYGTGEYLTAAYHLNNFAKTFPSSERAEEAQFLNAYCYYLDSPSSSLDQKSTLDAIQQFQLFLNRYPQSSRAEECNRLIDRLRFKLESKDFNNAKLYYRMGRYSAAVIAFENVVKDYPASVLREECFFYQVKSSYRYAENSVETKRKERFNNVIEHYYKLVDAFPSSKFLPEAEKYFEDAKKQISRLDRDISVNSRL